jgi:transposase
VEDRFAGVDWASTERAACVVDGDGRIVEARRYRHDERGIRAPCDRLIELAVALVALERPDGLAIERLLDAGLRVIAVHPNQVAAMRPRFSAAGGKSDGFDAFVLAELAHTDAHRFRVLVPDSDQTKALRALARARDELVAQRVALANELRAQLEAFRPGAAHIFADIDSPIALAFLRRYPSPADTHGLGEQRLERFLARHHYCARRSARELPGRLRGAAHGRAGQLETQARRRIVLALVTALEPIAARIAELTGEIRGALADHPDGRTFRSLFIDPKTAVCPATILSEIGDCRDRYPTVAALAGDAGQSPVAIESGKSKRARFRRACDHRLRAAIGTLADTSRHHNPWAADIYTRARQRGCTHQHAIRILGRAWCHVIWRLWHDHDVYDPNRHSALQRLLATTTRRPSRAPARDLTASQRPLGATVTTGCPQGRARSA